jgi:hypothetical protein
MTRAVLQTSTVTLVHALEGCLDMLTPDIIVRRRPSRRNAGTLASTRAERRSGASKLPRSVAAGLPIATMGQPSCAS